MYDGLLHSRTTERVEWRSDDVALGASRRALEALGGQDAVYDSELGQLRALGVSSAYVGYEHQWRPWLQSAVTYGVVHVTILLGAGS